MKDYAPGTWGFTFIFSLEGSVFPKAVVCAFPNAILAVIFWYVLREIMGQDTFELAQSGVTISQSWSAYNWVIGFMVSFRAQRAYSRWWEGGTLLQQARGEWFNAYSSLIAFCTKDTAKTVPVRKFQKVLSRLTSMLYASALMSIATESDLDFEIIDASGLSEEHLIYLRTQPDKCEIIMQWIQRLIVDNMGNGVLAIAPPVLSRVFQELSRGIVNIHNVRKITEFQFPFPAAQMIVTMLMVQWLLTPVVAALLMKTPIWAFLVAFFPVFACWGINYIAGEIEQPFGTDYNDMPLHFMQSSLNSSILSLLDEQAQSPPDFDLALDNTQTATVLGEKAPGDNKFGFSKMRSVRCVTISDPEQHYRVKHRFLDHTPDERSSKASWTRPERLSWARASREQSNFLKKSATHLGSFSPASGSGLKDSREGALRHTPIVPTSLRRIDSQDFRGSAVSNGPGDVRESEVGVFSNVASLNAASLNVGSFVSPGSCSVDLDAMAGKRRSQAEPPAGPPGTLA